MTRAGQLLNGNMMDYLVPMAGEMPDIDIGHVVTPTADSELGAKGAGEAGTAGAPACIMNAINDALRPLGAAPIVAMPITPERVLRALGKAVAFNPSTRLFNALLSLQCPPEETHAWRVGKIAKSSSSAAASAGLPRRWRWRASGIASQIIEQAPEFKEIGAGIQLGPNVFWMFEMLGLIEPVSALAVFPNNLIMMDSITGEEVTRVSLGEAFRKKFKHPYALIHRADLHKVLLEACRKSDRIRLDAGAESRQGRGERATASRCRPKAARSIAARP